MAERQSCKLKVLGSIPSDGCMSGVVVHVCGMCAHGTYLHGRWYCTAYFGLAGMRGQVWRCAGVTSRQAMIAMPNAAIKQRTARSPMLLCLLERLGSKARGGMARFLARAKHCTRTTKRTPMLQLCSLITCARRVRVRVCARHKAWRREQQHSQT